MATSKKSIKTLTLTNEQFSTLKDVSEKLNQIKYLLENQKGEENISSIMFDVGAAVENVRWCEDAVDNIINVLDDEDNSW